MNKEEAIKILRELHDKALFSERTALETLHPELKESEDEKAKKEITELVMQPTWKTEKEFYRRKELVAWLEKQGKQKETLCDKCRKEQPSHSCQDITALGRCYIEGISRFNKVKPKFKVGDTIRLKNSTAEYTIESISDGCYHGKGWSLNIIDADKSGDYVLVEHKYTLSDEEEKARRALIEMVHDTIPAEFEKCNTTKVDCLVWLRKQGKQKSVGEEIVEALRTEYEKGRADAFAQMQKEWSEEDENGLGDALWCCKQAASIVKDENDMGNVWYAEHWLKSLKERYTWKPSDEQMRALEYIIDNAHNTSYSCKIAKELLEQLKKLKGEEV